MSRIFRERFSSAALLLGAALILAACGNQHSASTAQGAGEAAASSAGTGGAVATLAAQKPATTGAAEPSTITRVNEDGSETVEDSTADSGSHNPLLAAVASTAVAATTTGAGSPWQEGLNYTRLVPAQPTSVPAGQVEVLEFFWYRCPHCYALDALVETWKKNKPAYVTFSRVPVMWNDEHRSFARMFYALDSMGKLNDVHSAIFKEIHVRNNPLIDLGNNEAQSERIQTAFLQSQGIAPDAFKAAYHSFAVETALQRADQLTQRYRVSGVPTFVINGKYIADVGTAQGEDKLMALVSDLAASEHKH